MSSSDAPRGDVPDPSVIERLRQVSTATLTIISYSVNPCRFEPAFVMRALSPRSEW